MTDVEPFAINHSFSHVLAAAGVRMIGYTGFGPSGLAVRIAMPDKRIGSIIASQADAADGVEYLHASIQLDSMPTYEDLVLLHRAVFGRRRWAYQVFAPENEHVDIHPFALHIWGRADGKPVLPNFGEGGTI